jgi:VWFA-related protein
MEATGETALHDSVVFTLYHFGGLRGQRAIILLTDGEDSISHYSFEEALDFARESGVAVYTIGLDISSRAHEARSKMMRISNETGGQSFFISRASQLDQVYRTIELELRSQYLLAYQSTLQGDDFRRVKVEMSDPSLKAKTIRGYDP